MKILPDPLLGRIYSVNTFVAANTHVTDTTYKIVWDFGDGTKKDTIRKDTTVRHTFTTIDTFTVRAVLFADTGKVAQDSATAQITEPGADSAIIVNNKIIGTQGGTITTTDTTATGFKIVIPPNSFSTQTIYSIQAIKITGTLAGVDSVLVKPVSRLFRITSKSGYADSIMRVTIPVKLPKNYFAMGFYYNEQTHNLEALPLDSLDTAFAALSTRHFMSDPNNASRGLWQTASIFIGGIDETILHNAGVIDSKFAPGVDDWEFVNYGSYIAHRGHCAGQSMTSMWYYYEQKLKGKKNLYHAYDSLNNATSPAFCWFDNPRGYRFASMIQKDFTWDDWIAQLEFQWKNNLITWKAFAYAMLVTKQPQFVLIRNSGGNHEAHAMVIYKVDQPAGKLYVADPNYPNNRDPKDGAQTIRMITFVNNGFEAYPSKLNANAGDLKFDQIGFFAKTAYIKWPQIGARYTEFVNGTIGSVGAHPFPPYTVTTYRDTAEIPLTDGFVTDAETLTVMHYSEACTSMIVGTDSSQVFYVLNDSGRCIAAGTDANSGVAEVKLKPGKNRLGFYLTGKRDTVDHFLDYKWMTVNRIAMRISPDPLVGIVGATYRFTAENLQMGKTPFKILWDFGDTTPVVTVKNDTNVTHSYAKANSFTVHATVCDINNNIITQDSSMAYIDPVRISITPDPLNGLPGVSYTFTVNMFGFSEKVYRIAWDFGNGSSQSVSNDSTVNVSYSTEGTYILHAALYNSSNVKLAEDSAQANIYDTQGDPVITRITPDSAVGEQDITIIGKRFGNAVMEGWVSVNSGDSMKIVSWSNTQIVATVPLYAEHGINVYVVRDNGPSDYPHWSDPYSYNIYADVKTTLKKVNQFYFSLAGLYINEKGDTSYVQTGSAGLDKSKKVPCDGVTFKILRSDTSNKTPGKEIFYDWNISFTFPGSAGLTGSILCKGTNRFVDTANPLITGKNISVSNMKVALFDHDFVTFSAKNIDKDVITSFQDDGGHGWDNYVKIDTLQIANFVFSYIKSPEMKKGANPATERHPRKAETAVRENEVPKRNADKH